MWIDMTSPIRALYFPLCHSSGEGFEDICTYLMVDFRIRDSVAFRNRIDGQRFTRSFNSTAALGFVALGLCRSMSMICISTVGSQGK